MGSLYKSHQLILQSEISILFSLWVKLNLILVYYCKKYYHCSNILRINAEKTLKTTFLYLFANKLIQTSYVNNRFLKRMT